MTPTPLFDSRQFSARALAAADHTPQPRTPRGNITSIQLHPKPPAAPVPHHTPIVQRQTHPSPRQSALPIPKTPASRTHSAPSLGRSAPDLSRHRAFAEELGRCDALVKKMDPTSVQQACVTLRYMLVALDHAQPLVKVLDTVVTGDDLATAVQSTASPPPRLCWNSYPIPLLFHHQIFLVGSISIAT